MSWYRSTTTAVSYTHLSNAVDATTKLRALIARGTEVGSTEALRVEVLLDKEARTPVSYTHLDVYKRQV